MEQQDILNKPIGSKELPKLEAKNIMVQGQRVDEKDTKGNKKANLLVLLCKHPNKEEPIDMTKIKVLQGDKAKVVGLWIQQDEDGNIQKGSAIHTLLSVAGVNTIGELTGKTLPTIKQSEDSQYLCIKGY